MSWRSGLDFPIFWTSDIFDVSQKTCADLYQGAQKGRVFSVGAARPDFVPDHVHDIELNRSNIMNMIGFDKLERDAQINLRNLRRLDCIGKPVVTFPHRAFICIA
jgi:hypothetical protein